MYMNVCGPEYLIRPHHCQIKRECNVERKQNLKIVLMLRISDVVGYIAVIFRLILVQIST